MGDNISRQAAIDALCKRCDLVHDVPCTEECNDIKVLRKLPSTDEWIPCSERLPRKNGKHLCCWQGASVGTGMFLDGHFRLYGEIKDNLVTAWMPLPEPYKKMKAEENRL